MTMVHRLASKLGFFRSQSSVKPLVAQFLNYLISNPTSDLGIIVTLER
jgi:hypothetical protein